MNVKKFLNLTTRAAVIVIALASCRGDGPQFRTVASMETTVSPTSTVASTTTTARPRPPVTHASRSYVRPQAVAPTVVAGDWAALVSSLPWDAATAMRIVSCESGGRPWAVNPSSGAAGLFQILGGPLEPLANVRLAFSMYSQRGWQPWYSSAKCWR